MKDSSVDSFNISHEKAQEAATAADEGVLGENGSLGTEQYEDLQKRAAKADEHWERLLRVSADLDNYKKRAAREKLESIKFANEKLIEKLIPILDNFEMALAAAKASPATQGVESLIEGVSMIQQRLKTTLTEFGLEEVDASGQVFDPNFHEAVSQMQSAEVPEGHVLQQMRKGYKLKERLLRPASVVVAAKL